MVNAKLDFPFLERLLLCGEVIHIRIRYIERFAKQSTTRSFFLVYDVIRQLKQSLVVISEKPSVQNMIIISSAVKAYETELHESLNILRLGINHTNYRLTLACDFVVYEEEVGKHFDIIKYKICVRVVHRCRSFFRLELHLVYELKTILCLVCATASELNDCIFHIANVIAQATCICVLKNLINIIHARLSRCMILFIEIPTDHRADGFLIFYSIPIYQLIISF